MAIFSNCQVKPTSFTVMNEVNGVNSVSSKVDSKVDSKLKVEEKNNNYNQDIQGEMLYGEVCSHCGSDRIYMSGYSSCGYAALYTALTSTCHGYLGFSQPIDLRGDSPLDPPLYFTQDVRAAVDPGLLIDLKPLLQLADPAVRRTFIYGERNAHDTMHARHIADIAHLEVVAMPHAAHSTVEDIGARDELLSMFVRLIAD